MKSSDKINSITNTTQPCHDFNGVLSNTLTAKLTPLIFMINCATNDVFQLLYLFVSYSTLLISVAYLTLLERKVMAAMQGDGALLLLVCSAFCSLSRMV